MRIWACFGQWSCYISSMSITRVTVCVVSCALVLSHTTAYFAQYPLFVVHFKTYSQHVYSYQWMRVCIFCLFVFSYEFCFACIYHVIFVCIISVFYQFLYLGCTRVFLAVYLVCIVIVHC